MSRGGAHARNWQPEISHSEQSDGAARALADAFSPKSPFARRWQFAGAGIDAARRLLTLIVQCVAAECLAMHREQRSLLRSLAEANSAREIDRHLVAMAKCLAETAPPRGAEADEAEAREPPALASFVAHLPDGERADPALILDTARSLAALQLLPSVGCLRDTRDALACGPMDLFGELYQRWFPRRVRHALGEYYTPPWLVEHVLDAVGYDGDPATRVLDPTCGAGAFVLAALHRALIRSVGGGTLGAVEEARLAQQLTANIAGFELTPLAALCARTNYLIALGPLVRHVDPSAIPILCRDVLLDAPGLEPMARVDSLPEHATARALARAACAPFDFIVGNPPWVAWDNLTSEYRARTRSLWQHYGLFSLGTTAARHGGAKKDLAMLVLYASADRYLRGGGRLGMVLPQTLLQTKGAGDGFRRFQIGSGGAPLGVIRVDDLVAARPFVEAANWTCAVILEKGRPTTYPVSYYRWPASKPLNRGAATRGKTETRRAPAIESLVAEPVDPQRPTSPWFLRPGGWKRPLADLIGPSDYKAHLGANTGGGNGVYWLELCDGDTPHATPRDGDDGEPSADESSSFGDAATEGDLVSVRNVPALGRQPLDSVACTLESELLFPLLRWGDVDAFSAMPRLALLLPQDCERRTGLPLEAFSRHYPRALAYLRRFEPLLLRRAAHRRYQSRGPFYSMYNVGPYTLSAHKVVWRRMDARLRAAAVGPLAWGPLAPRPVVPQETCVFIAAGDADEAHYLAALLNSAVVRFLVDAHSVRGGKGFGTPSILDYLRLRKFDPRDRRHVALAAASRAMHDRATAAPRATEKARSSGTCKLDECVAELQRAIDGLAGDLWGLAAAEQELLTAFLAGRS